jgi:spore coat protein U-like protein
VRWTHALTLAAALAMLLTPSRALAAGSCSISVTSVVFGNYNVFDSSDQDSTGTVVFRCNGGAKDIVVTLGQGQSGTFSPRTMRNGSEALAYNLYLNAARTTVWGDGTNGTQTYFSANPPNNTDVTVTIYGRIPAGADVSAGSYSDTVSAVINF